ncbi:MAG TPA: GAF and ANTAR domain-containing protein [Kribbella sp.]|nr:GAF and ANTAR domain-containing protein [Kribbella sp.]
MATEDPQRHDQTDVVTALHTLLVNAPSVDEFLDQLADVAARVLDPPASCGVTTRYEGHPLTVATSDDRAAIIDEDQYGAGEGPCLESMRTGEVIEVSDQCADDRWDAYRQKAVEHGVRCSLSNPLVVDDHPVGALNLYVFDRPDAFDDENRQRTSLFAAQASAALTLAVRSAQQTELAAQLEQALSSRTVIDQAIGLLMGQQRCDADTAFTLLRKHSQNNNLKLRDVAVELITRVSGHPPVSGRPFEN